MLTDLLTALFCSAYEVATAAATALGADKMLCMLDGSVFDDNGRLLRWMTLQEADSLVRERAETSGAAANYVDLMKGPPCITLLSGPGYGKTLDLDEKAYTNGQRVNGARGNGRGVNGASVNGAAVNGASVNGASANGASVNGTNMNGIGVNGASANVHGVNGANELCDLSEECATGHALMNGINGMAGMEAGGFSQAGQILTDANGNVYKTTPWKRGFPVKGGDRLEGGDGYLAELAAAVYACKGGVRRVHLVDATVGGSLLLELYTRDGIGTMISSDLYEGTRGATNRDLVWIQGLLKPLEDDGILVKRSDEQMLQELPNFTVVERDGAVIACAALFPLPGGRCAEVAAFAVAPECRGHGRGDNLLGKMAPLEKSQLFSCAIDESFCDRLSVRDLWFLKQMLGELKYARESVAMSVGTSLSDTLEVSVAPEERVFASGVCALLLCQTHFLLSTDYLEKKATGLGLERLVLLTTRTADWFVQRGFVEGSLGDLPPDRRARVNTSRNSKVFVKELNDVGSPRSSYATDARFAARV